MAVKKIYELEHDNKENIPPLPSQSKKLGPIKKNGKRKVAVKKREWRSPLRDITNLYMVSDRMESSAPSLSVYSCLGKRKLDQDEILGAEHEHEHEHCSKILRKEYR